MTDKNQPKRKRRHLTPGEFKEEGFPLQSEHDHEILLHREAHFGGQFDVMLDYYRKGGRGINPEFDIQTIEMLATLEKEMEQNLAATILTGPEAEKIKEVKNAYKNLRDLYDQKLESDLPLLIADLILTEDEEAEKEIAAIVEKKESIVPSLLEVVKSEVLYDPLFPGYGKAPILAAKCLGLIGDKRAVITIFEMIHEGEFFDEDVLFEALGHIGEPAKQFLLKVATKRPITLDNERAAIALVHFKDDPEVADACFKMLQDSDVLKNEFLSTYFVLGCEGLDTQEKRFQLIKLAEDSNTSKSLKNDIKMVVKSWEL